MQSDENMDLQEEIIRIREMLRQREPKVKEHIEAALPVAESLGDKEKIGDLLVSLSNYYALIKRDLDRCVEYADKAKPYYDVTNPRRASYYYGNLGINYHFFFKLPEAQAAYLTAIQHMEKIEDHTMSESNMLATIYYNLYILFSFTDLAILDRSYLDRAMALYEKNNHVPGIIFCYGAIINDLDKHGKIEEALEYSLKRLKLATDTDNALQTGLSASTTGLLYAKLQDRELSDKYFAQAHDILFGKEIVPFHASYYDEKAQAYLALGEYEKSIDSFKEALHQYTTIASTLNLSKLYKLLSEAYEKAGKYPEAMEYQRMYSQVLLDNFKVDKVLYMGAAQKDFEKEQKERETTMLKQKNEEIQLYVNQLEQSNEELKQFAHAASHDLREPVRMIVSYTELLEMSLRNQLSPEQQEFFAYLKEGGKRINEMISGILTFSKVNSHDELTVVELSSTMNKVRENLKLALAAKGAKIECEKLPTIRSNSILMIQLFQNLISNAVKYNQSEHPLVKISCSREDGMYQFVVSDNGIGIDDKYRDTVFDMFSRLHNRENYSGSGIGLAICKKIVERMGGTIRNERNGHNGTDFIFTLPANY